MPHEDHKFESLEARAARYELEYEQLYRQEYGSGNSTKKEHSEHYKKLSTFSSDTNFGLLRKIVLFNRVIVGGQFKQKKSSKGNKRLGRTLFYGDILNCFLELKRQGIKLPKNVLSQKACKDGLIEVLRQHKKIPENIINRKSFNAHERERIRKSNESAFARIIKFL
jgi:hypothetical protein